MNKESFLKSLEMLVAIAFGIAYWLYDLHIATIVLIVAMTIFVALVKFLGEKLTRLQLVSWIAVVLLGGATVFLRDENFIKWKPTAIHSVVGLTFLITQLIGKKTILERMIEDKVPAPRRMLRKVNFSSAIFFFLIAALNILIAENFSTTFWVNFKIFGISILSMFFMGGCLFYLKDYLHNLISEEEKNRKN